MVEAFPIGNFVVQSPEAKRGIKDTMHCVTCYKSTNFIKIPSIQDITGDVNTKSGEGNPW